MCDVISKEKYTKAYSIPDVEFRNLTNGIKFRDTKFGDGLVVEKDDVVSVQYTGRLLGGREVESTSSLSGGAAVLTAGGSEAVAGVCQGIIGMSEYGSRELLVPPPMHYPGRFPNQIMIYDVMVRRVIRKHSPSSA